MPRLTGKTGGIYAESTRTNVIVALTMTDSGDEKTYILTGKPYWDSTKPPTILVNGLAPAISSTVDYIEGSITFVSALLITDVVTVNNITYSTLIKIGDLFNWTVDAKLDTVDVTAFEDIWHNLLSTFLGWAATIDGYHVSGYWWTAFNNSNCFYFKFYPDVNASPTEYFIGNGFIDYSIKVAKDAAVTEALPVKGTGVLKRKTV